jgi:hypothetical protein
MRLLQELANEGKISRLMPLLIENYYLDLLQDYEAKRANGSPMTLADLIAFEWLLERWLRDHEALAGSSSGTKGSKPTAPPVPPPMAQKIRQALQAKASGGRGPGGGGHASKPPSKSGSLEPSFPQHSSDHGGRAGPSAPSKEEEGCGKCEMLLRCQILGCVRDELEESIKARQTCKKAILTPIRAPQWDQGANRRQGSGPGLD